MKRILTLAALVVFAAPLGAQNQWLPNVVQNGGVPRGGAAGDVAATLHNLNTRMAQAGRPGGDIQAYRGEICIYCHTPHKTTSDNLPLWNRNLPTQSYSTYYTAATRPGQQQPGPTSLSCLSCHDGTIALDNIANKGNYPAPASLGGFIMGFANIGAGRAAGSTNDLSNDHPIGIDYPADGSSPGFNPLASLGALRLYSFGGTNRVECASCHDPHRESPTHRFERISNDGSAMCLTCHVK